MNIFPIRNKGPAFAKSSVIGANACPLISADIHISMIFTMVSIATYLNIFNLLYTKNELLQNIIGYFKIEI